MSWGRKLRGEEGSALPLTLLVAVLLLVLGSSLLSAALLERNIARNQLLSTQALYVADSGIEMVLAELQYDEDWLSLFPGLEEGETVVAFAEVPIGRGTLKEVTLTDRVTTVEVLSEAEVNGITRSVKAQILKPVFEHGFAGATAGSSGGGGNELTIRANSYIEGTLVFRHNININTPQAEIHGDVVAGGNIVNKGHITGDALAGGAIINSGTIDGDQLPDADVYLPEIPEVDLDWYESRADVLFSGDQTWDIAELQEIIDNELNNRQGIIYVDGDVTIKNKGEGQEGKEEEEKEKGSDKGGKDEGEEGDKNESRTNVYRGRVMLVTSRSIEIDGDLLPDSTETSALGLVAFQDIEVGGNTKITGVFHAGRTFRTSGNAEITGTIVTDDFIVDGHLNLIYDENLVIQLQSFLPGNRFRLVSWQEFSSIL
ncbi:hypothetical protein [Calderihabitans maritimus]|uniref:O-acetylhomoserine sulfhydrylase n=1 Tax=Calderihabitans maritimus TaxID=1246530 RepID=A0A1Z5HXJ6_9FIRM|nr:hypothetical protein [Calderihabitans maritimus]GAW94138.1 O-acetylhomoserine sulfhydrylase [Calderihabitans maritimus]